MSTTPILSVPRLSILGLLLSTCLMLTAENMAENEGAVATRPTVSLPTASQQIATEPTASLQVAAMPTASLQVAALPNASLPAAALAPASLRIPFLTPRPVLACKNGCATYYSRCLNGGRSADGGRVDLSKFTAAHRSYPFGTVLRVTRVKTGKSVEVRVTDRLPSTRSNNKLGIIIDLTHAAASKLDMMRDGRVQVKVEVLEWGGKKGKEKGKSKQTELIANS